MTHKILVGGQPREEVRNGQGATILMGVATVLLMALICWKFWAEYESTRGYRDRLDSLNKTLDIIGSR